MGGSGGGYNFGNYRPLWGEVCSLKIIQKQCVKSDRRNVVNISMKVLCSIFCGWGGWVCTFKITQKKCCQHFDESIFYNSISVQSVV